MPSIVRGPARASLLAAVVVVGLSLAGSESALSAYVPPGFKPAEFSSVAGKSTAYSATLAKGNCMNFGDVEVFWGDGKSDSEGSVVQVTETSATVTFSGTHEYTAAGDFLGTVNFMATCINNLGKSSHVFQKGTPGGYPMGFIVHVAPGAAFPPAKTAPKKAVPQPVKDYFKAKEAQLAADAAFFCGEFVATGKPTPASAVAYAAFLPYCTAVVYRLG